MPVLRVVQERLAFNAPEEQQEEKAMTDLFPDPFKSRDPSFSVRPPIAGPDVTAADETRLLSLLSRVREHMADGSWRTLAEISEACRGSEASVSARLRDLRRNGHTIEKKRLTRATWLYRVA